MKKPNTITILLTVAGLLTLLLTSLMFVYTFVHLPNGCQMRGKTPQYWDHPVPDGVYEVMIWEDLDENLEFTGTSFSFPFCPSYGGQLHGTWKVAGDLRFPEGMSMSEFERVDECWWDGTYYTGDDGKQYKNLSCTWKNVTVICGWVNATVEDDIIISIESLER